MPKGRGLLYPFKYVFLNNILSFSNFYFLIRYRQISKTFEGLNFIYHKKIDLLDKGLVDLLHLKCYQQIYEHNLEF
jgi:hypothetical protein